MRGAEQFVKFVGIRIAGDDDALRFLQRKIQRVQHERHRLRKILQPVREQSQSLFGGLGEILPPGDGAEFQQRERGDGIAGSAPRRRNRPSRAKSNPSRRSRFARSRRFPRHKIWRSSPRPVQSQNPDASAPAWPRKVRSRRKAETHSLRATARCRVRRRASGGKASGDLPFRSDCCLPAAHNFSRMNCQIFLRRRAIFFLAQNGGRPRKRAEHQAVPRRENLVVQMRADAFRPRGEHFRFGGGEQFSSSGRDAVPASRFS